MVDCALFRALTSVNQHSGRARDGLGVRIAFVAANREQLPDPVVPLGLLQVVESCPPWHERLLLDLCFEEDPARALRAFVDEQRPDLIALSLRNLHANDYGPPDANVAYYHALVRTVREVSAAPVVIGGGGFSVLPGPLLARIGADFGIAGEGERAFPLLVEALFSGRGIDAVPGVYRREGNRVVPPARPPAPVDLASLPIADRRRVDRRHYARCGIESVQTRRGCPLACTYCTYPAIEGRTSRLRPPTSVADELMHIREAAPEVSHFYIVDSVFNLPPSHASRVCDAIAERRIGLPWTCYVNPIDFHPSLADRMAAAGCIGIEIGSDSGDDRVLRRLRKGFGTEDVHRAHRVAREAGLLDCHTFLLGTPGETLDEVRRTLDFVDDLDPAAAILMVWNDDADLLGGISAERAELRERILELLARTCRERRRWVVPPLGYRFDARLFALLRRRGLRGPLWQHLVDLDRPGRRDDGSLTPG